jgi:hypothetical protein
MDKENDYEEYHKAIKLLYSSDLTDNEIEDQESKLLKDFIMKSLPWSLE